MFAHLNHAPPPPFGPKPRPPAAPERPVLHASWKNRDLLKVPCSLHGHNYGPQRADARPTSKLQSTWNLLCSDGSSESARTRTLPCPSRGPDSARSVTDGRTIGYDENRRPAAPTLPGGARNYSKSDKACQAVPQGLWKGRGPPRRPHSTGVPFILGIRPGRLLLLELELRV